jgi:DNA topoisomerase-1
MDLVNSQQARRILDRLVGYKLSPFLWKKVKKGLSAGRVQSVATRLVVDREEEINAFVAKEYWNITALLHQQDRRDETFEAKFYGLNDQKLEINTKQEADDILTKAQTGKYVVKSVKEGQRKKNPPLPFTTSTLQQEANRKLGFTTRKTMMIAQQLYEGVDIEGVGYTGLITYLRTDSVRISEEARSACLAYISDVYGKEYAMYAKKKAAKKSGKVQDAHEAIRPTAVDFTPESLQGSLSRDQIRLYELIYKRFVASNMKPANYDTLSVEISCEDLLFTASGSRIAFEGYLKVYNNKTDEDKEYKLPALKEGEVLALEEVKAEQKFTQPPARYTEAGLVKALEERGIGRPSTYAPTIATIQNRGYVAIEEKKFLPTELGSLVTQLMKENFADIVDYDFTAQMEGELDNVAEGKADWVNVVSDFYTGFEKELEKAQNIEKVKLREEVTDVLCDKCGKNMVIKEGRYGKFLACPGFPDCRNIKPYNEEVDALCPKCGAKLVRRKTKKGRIFYGCLNYPDCDFSTWNTLSKEKCKTCDSLKFKKSRAKDAKAYCLKCDDE